jgi:hypothetical protein
LESQFAPHISHNRCQMTFAWRPTELKATRCLSIIVGLSKDRFRPGTDNYGSEEGLKMYWKHIKMIFLCSKYCDVLPESRNIGAAYTNVPETTGS